MSDPTVEMSCKELAELITDYLEGALPAAERQRLEEHMRGCPGCQTYLEQMQQTIRTIGRLSEETIPPWPACGSSRFSAAGRRSSRLPNYGAAVLPALATSASHRGRFA